MQQNKGILIPSITRQLHTEHIPLSFSQERLWFIDQLEGSVQYHLPVVVRMRGQLDEDALKYALGGIVSRHEVLRAVILQQQGGEVYQHVLEDGDWRLDVVDEPMGHHDSASLKKYIQDLVGRPFDLSRDYKLRAHLIRMSKTDHILVLTLHHIASDRWSSAVLVKELVELYSSRIEGRDVILTDLPVQYSDYALWQRNYLTGEVLERNLSYWKKKLAGVEVLILPTDFARPTIQSTRGSTRSFRIDKDLSEQLEKLSQQQGTSLFMTLLAAFKVLMHRYCRQTDICVGSQIAGRRQQEVEGLIGFFVNTLALRTDLGENPSFKQLLHRVKETTLEAYEHQDAPIEKVVESVVKGGDISRSPLFQVMFALENNMRTEVKGRNLGNLVLQAESPEVQTSKYDITLLMSENMEGELSGSMEYCNDLFEAETIERMVGHYKELLKAAAADPDQGIGELQMLTEKERQQLLFDFNDTITDYSKQSTLQELFEQQVLRTPDHIALIQGEQTMSYRQLNERSNRLARYLMDCGLSQADNIGILVTRGFDMMVSMYAILKAGGAYVPIDPEYPVDRQEYIVKQSGVTLIIADDDYPLKNLVGTERLVQIKNLSLDDYAPDNLGISTDPKQLAYTIYTSGSTGRPKGVMIEHHSAVNLIQWVNSTFEVGPQDRLLFITSMCFDLSVYDIFGILSAGASLVIARQQEVQDVKQLQEMLQTYGITFWDSVPTTMDYLVRELETSHRAYSQPFLKTIFMSGDWIPVDLPERIKKYFPNTQVISLGGATEGTVWSNYYPVTQPTSTWTSIPYGKPIQNNFFYILNEQLQPVPQGVTGDLFIGGVGVARGYANEPEKTNYSFIQDPFNSRAGGRMYRTGDLGRMLPDMNMQFMGRKDAQVKIRGFRVELEEIESVLKQSGLIRQAVVLARDDRDNKKRLVGYVVPNGSFDRQEVLTHLKSKLPDYMIPAAWVELDSLPLTSNGKIDKKALLEMDDMGQIKERYVAPRTDLEMTLAEIWQDVLGLEKVGITDNFFELGGYSLNAVQIMTKIENKTGKKLPLAIFFKYPTIAQQVASSLVQNNADSVWKALVPIKTTGSKMPLYIVHGDGLNVLNFHDLANYVDPEQPILGLQAIGLDGIQSPLDDISEIAKRYISEILEDNPNGPYAIGGYSFGGYVAIEMRKQLEVLGKEVKMVAMFDTNAQNAEYANSPVQRISKKIRRQVPKFVWFSKLFVRRPKTTINYQFSLLIKFLRNVGLVKTPEPTGIYVLFNKINEKHHYAFSKYRLEPFNGKLHLFKSRMRIYFVDDQKYLGWTKYAQKGVKVYDVPGDHETMFHLPHVKEFAQILQNALDSC
jgi:amino acid adenylation domain-containing protein